MPDFEAIKEAGAVVVSIGLLVFLLIELMKRARERDMRERELVAQQAVRKEVMMTNSWQDLLAAGLVGGLIGFALAGLKYYTQIASLKRAERRWREEAEARKGQLR